MAPNIMPKRNAIGDVKFFQHFTLDRDFSKLNAVEILSGKSYTQNFLKVVMCGIVRKLINTDKHTDKNECKYNLSSTWGR